MEKVKKAATAWFLAALSHALTQCTSQGLEAFWLKPGCPSKHRMWQTQQGIPPSIAIVSDQASVCNAGVFALQRKLDVTAEGIYDTIHRISNGLLGGLKRGVHLGKQCCS